MATSLKVTPGILVKYHAKTRGYPMAAFVTMTKEYLDAEGVRRKDVPDLDSNTHVHLNVQSPGPKMVYQEHNVPFDPEGRPGTWCWWPMV